MRKGNAKVLLWKAFKSELNVEITIPGDVRDLGRVRTPKVQAVLVLFDRSL